MRQSIVFLLGLAALGFAQDSTVSATDSSTPTPTDSTTPAPSPTDSSSSTNSAATSSSTNATSTSQGPITHTIGVALGGFTFVPDVTLAQVGDTILFQFYPTNHSVIRAEYGYPCIPYEDTGVDKVGFFSGFFPVDAILPNPPEFTILVNDTKPIFLYCGATGSCIEHQMIGVINPNATTSLQHQKDLAGQSQFMLLPGQPWPDESQDPFTTSSSTPSPSTPSPTASPSATGSAAAASGTNSSDRNHSSLSSGAIAGIAIGATAVALAAAVALYLCGRQSRVRDNKHMDDRPSTGHATQVSYNPANGHMSYMTDPSKHMSMHSSVVGLGPSPALPGYVASHDPSMSPGLHPSYMPVSDSLGPVPSAPGSGLNSPHSPSPSQMYSVPAYPGSLPQSAYQTPHHSGMYTSVPPPQVHEMAGSEALPGTPQSPPPQGAGIMGFIRRSSVSKAGGVERYG